MLYEVIVTKKVEEKIMVRGCGTKEEAMAAAKGASAGPNISEICIKDIKLIGKERAV
jgi:hypothetical protein